MKFAQAEKIAAEKLAQIRPYCKRAEIAGSVRRRKEECGDIEIVCIPRIITDKVEGDLFSLQADRNLLYEWATEKSGINWIKPGTPEIIPWQPKPHGKYWRALLPENIKLDLFLVTPPAQWGVLFTLRTGNRFFSHWLVTSENRKAYSEESKKFYRGALPYFAEVKDGVLKENGLMKSTPEEIDFLKYCGVGFVEPRDRNELFVDNFLRRKI